MTTVGRVGGRDKLGIRTEGSIQEDLVRGRTRRSAKEEETDEDDEEMTDENPRNGVDATRGQIKTVNMKRQKKERRTGSSYRMRVGRSGKKVGIRSNQR